MERGHILFYCGFIYYDMSKRGRESGLHRKIYTAISWDVIFSMPDFEGGKWSGG